MSLPNRPTSGTEPAEGLDDPGIPGADTGEPNETPRPGSSDVPAGRETERRDELADRTGAGRPSPAGGDRPDLITGTDVPDAQM